MKIVLFGPERRTGMLAGDRVIDANEACAKYLGERRGEPRPLAMAAALVPAGLAGLIESGPRAIEQLQRAADYVLTEAGDQLSLTGRPLVQAVQDVRLHAPWPGRGSKIACAGGNYVAHSAAMTAAASGQQLTHEEVFQQARTAGMWGFWKIIAEVMGPGEDIVYPTRTKRMDYEGEVAVVLGSRGKDLSQAQARDAVWGVTLLVDWSTRDSGEQSRGMSFNLAKNFDTSTSMGPCIVVGELDPQEVDCRTVVNGEERQQYNTRDMTFSFAEYLEYLSRDLTFLPGDILSGGTGSGTAMESSRADGGAKFLKPGDVVEVSSPQVGSLPSRIAAKAA